MKRYFAKEPTKISISGRATTVHTGDVVYMDLDSLEELNFEELTEEEEIEMPGYTLTTTNLSMNGTWYEWAQQVTNTLNSLTKERKK